ncbi:MAG TPA: hypothetical protein VEK73_10950 [Xanthobacteraceae bacterium]|nr:hypothetical protein [Xanthobacteraceae bacterium]
MMQNNDKPLRWHFPSAYTAAPNQPHDLVVIENGKEMTQVTFRAFTATDLEFYKNLVCLVWELVRPEAVRVMTKEGEVICQRARYDVVREAFQTQTLTLGGVGHMRVAKALKLI